MLCMSSTDGAAVLSVRGPADLISAVPYLLGFHPRQSLVVVGMARSQVVVTMRTDLDDVAEAAALEHLIASMARGGAEAAVVVIYDDTAGPFRDRRPWQGLVRQFAAATAAADVTLEDALLVSAGRFWSYACGDPRCCPREGIALPQHSPVAAAATFAGLVALPDRASVAQLLEPAGLLERLALQPALDAALETSLRALSLGSQAKLNRSATRALFARARAAQANGNTLPGEDDDLAQFAVALRRREVRDAVWTAIDDGRLSGDALWRLLAHRLPSPYDAAPLFLLGWDSWRQGNGALARMAADRALDSDPSYSAAGLLHAALTNGVDPRVMPRLRRRAQRCDR
jgi:hypothetical protein